MNISRAGKNIFFRVLCIVSFFSVIYIAGFVERNLYLYLTEDFCYSNILMPTLICESLSYIFLIFALFSLPLLYFFRERKTYLFRYFLVLFFAMIIWGNVILYIMAVQ